MSNKEKINEMKEQLNKMWSEYILMAKSQDPVAKLHHKDVMEGFSSLVIRLACVADYED